MNSCREFKLVFGELFEGGAADIILVDPKDPLNMELGGHCSTAWQKITEFGFVVWW